MLRRAVPTLIALVAISSTTCGRRRRLPRRDYPRLRHLAERPGADVFLSCERDGEYGFERWEALELLS